MRDEKDLDKELTEGYLAKGEALDPDAFPCLTNVSAAFFHDFINKPKKQLPPEFAYISFDPNSRHKSSVEENPSIPVELLVAQWNMLWESGHLRSDLFRSKLPEELRWLTSFQDTNLYLLPDAGGSKYETFRVLYHLIPQRTCRVSH